MPITKDNAHLYLLLVLLLVLPLVLALVLALMEGKTIQNRDCDGGWCDLALPAGLIFICPPEAYRIKPDQDATCQDAAAKPKPVLSLKREESGQLWLVVQPSNAPQAMINLGYNGPHDTDALEAAMAQLRQDPPIAQMPSATKALKIISDDMKNDPEWAWTWHSNAAMAFVDEGGNHALANRAAARFMYNAFGVDTSKNKNYAGTQNAPAKQLLDDVQIGSRLKLRNGMVATVCGFKDDGRLVMANTDELGASPHPYRRDGRAMCGYASTVADPETIPEFDAIAVLPAEPTIRPWTLEEVPVGCIARKKGTNTCGSILNPEAWIGQDTVDNYEYSHDPAGTPYGKRTWLPCGVMP